VALGRSSDLASGEMAAERCLSLFSEMLATFYLVGFVQLVEAQIKIWLKTLIEAFAIARKKVCSRNPLPDICHDPLPC
jgi:hypothetical protein